jgi:hypothetical protein
MQSFISRSGLRATAVSLALLAIGACGKKSDQTATQSSGGTIAPASTTVQVADVTVGRGVAGDKRVANQTDTFAARDTIYASVHTTGAAPNTNLTARWTFQDGQVVDERTETISPSGDAYTEFHISKPSGWPAGRYTLHVLVNGQESQTKDFTVSR